MIIPVEYVFYDNSLMPYPKTVEWEKRSDTVFFTKLYDYSVFVEISSVNITCRLLLNGYMVSGQTFARKNVELKEALRASLNLVLATLNIEQAVLITGGTFPEDKSVQDQLF